MPLIVAFRQAFLARVQRNFRIDDKSYAGGEAGARDSHISEGEILPQIAIDC